MKKVDAGGRRPSFLRVILAMLGIAFRAHPGMFWIYLVTSLGFTALLIADLHLIRVLLDQMPLFSNGQIAYRAVLLTILLLGGVNILDTLMNAGMNISYEYLSRVANARMTQAMSQKAARLELIQFESSELFDGIEKANTGRERGFDAMESVLASLIFHGGYFLFLGIYLIPSEPLLVLGVFAAFLPVAISRSVRASAFYNTEGRVAPLRRAFAHFEACLVDRTYFKETRTAGAAAFFRRKYDQYLADYNAEMWRTEVRTGLLDLALKVLTLCGYVGLLWLLVHFVIGGRISAGLFGAIYFAMDSLFKWFEELFDRLGFALENAAFGGNYLAFLGLPERRQGKDRLRHDQGLELRHVSFRYPGAVENAIDDISIKIEPGQTVAIVGENGAGKSSLVRLLAGLYPPDGGVVLVGGIDPQKAADGERFKGISAVFQLYQRYRMTLLENVCISQTPENGLPPGTAESLRATAALQAAGFSQSGKSRPAGLQQMLAREFGGIDLSGGEWQRVAIARGLYRLHDTILLDEPTAAIDPIEEDRVYRMFLEAARGKTAIIVTHRLGLARSVGRILVMQHGRIVQDGSHADLMAVDGVYARLFRSQAAWFER